MVPFYILVFGESLSVWGRSFGGGSPKTVASSPKRDSTRPTRMRRTRTFLSNINLRGPQCFLVEAKKLRSVLAKQASDQTLSSLDLRACKVCIQGSELEQSETESIPIRDLPGFEDSPFRRLLKLVKSP
jgi:hypothetical protein